MGDAQDTRFWSVINDWKTNLVNEKLKEAHYRWRLREAELFAEMMDAPPGRIVRFTRIEQLPDPVAAWDGAPKCEMCGCEPWILVPHPLNKKRVCLECKAKGTEGWVPCPATHTLQGVCNLCRNTPGFIEEV